MPVSLFIILKTADNKAIPAAMSWDCVRLKSVSGRERYFAKARHTQILQNSAGWNCKLPPTLIMDCVPFTFDPNGKTRRIKNIPAAYQRLAVAGKNLLSVKSMNMPTTIDTIKK